MHYFLTMPDQYVSSIIITLIIGLVFIYLIWRAGRVDTRFPYEQREALFTPAEQNFLGSLKKAVGEDFSIFGKVRVADVIKPRDRLPNKRWHQVFHPIAAKHFDFVLCDPHDLFVLCVIELNDSSHDNPERQKRDEFLRQVCAAAGLPLIEFPARQRYLIKDIREEIESHTR